MLNKKYILLFTLFIVFLNSLVFAQNFIGPSCQPGQCQGRIGVDSNGNISMGTSTPQSNTLLYLVGSTADSSAYGLRIMNSNLGPILWVRNDGRVSIGTTTANYALNVSGDIYTSGNLIMAGNLSAPISSGNVTPGVFNSLQGGGTGAYAFLGSLGIATSSNAGLPQTLSVYGGGYFSGNVGIGIVNPNYPLDVVGLIRSQASGISAVVNANSSASIGYYGTISNHPVGFISNNTEFLRITTSGNVGIGTTNPAYKLDVQGGQINSSGGLCIAGDCKTSWSQVGGGGQWITTSTGIYYSGGNVGIGNVPAPTLSLNIETSSTAYTGIALVNTDVSSRSWAIFSNSNSTTFGPSKGFGIRDITAGATRFVIDTSGNVGIGTTAPNKPLDVAGTGGIRISRTDNGSSNNEIYFQDNGQIRSYDNAHRIIFDRTNNILELLEYGNIVFSPGATSGTRTQKVVFQSNGTVTVGGGTGKINVGTVDPPYTINGKKYATYVPAMTGQKEETTGVLRIKNSNCQNNICKYDIDFSNQEEGSDLWLFSKVTNLKNNFSKMSVLLTSDSKSKVWYNKNNNLVLSIYLEPQEQKEEYEVSYRLTAPRFDSEKFSNKRNDNDSLEPDGLIINN